MIVLDKMFLKKITKVDNDMSKKIIITKQFQKLVLKLLVYGNGNNYRQIHNHCYKLRDMKILQ